MAIVVRGLGANVSLAQRQSGLSAFEGLALAFLEFLVVRYETQLDGIFGGLGLQPPVAKAGHP